MTEDENNWRYAFYKLFFNSDCNERENGRKLLNNKRPHKFCKYMTQKHAIDFLHTFQLWHSSMKNFNDKYDGWWYEIDKMNNCTEEQKVAIQYFRESCGFVGDDDIATIFDLWKVCSLTINPLNENMWSEYAAHSTGVCFEFDIDDSSSAFLPQIYKQLYPVIYFNDKVNLTDLVLDSNNDEWDNHIFGTGFQDYFCILCALLKDAFYSDENEWRSLWMNPHYEGLFEVPTCPSRIYLGYRINPRVKRNIIKEIKNKNIACTVYQIVNINGKLCLVEINMKEE